MSYVTRVNESCHTCKWVMSHVYMSHVIHVNVNMHEWKDAYEWVTSLIWVIYFTHMTTSYHMNEYGTLIGALCHTHRLRKSPDCRLWGGPISAHAWFANVYTNAMRKMQYVAVCCSALQCVAVCCSVLQCVAVCCRSLDPSMHTFGVRMCGVLQCIVLWCSVVQCV